MSGESSEQPKKRGRPSHSPTDNRKTNKRITDKKARQEIRDIVVELTKAGPTLKQLLEAFRSINGDDLLQTVSYILDAIERWKGVQWQQNEEGNSMPCIQEIKDAISEAVSKEVSPLRNDLQNVMLPSFGGGKNGFLMTSQTLGSQCYQNFVQSADFPEQPNNQFENDLISSWPNPSILDGVLEEPWTNTMWPTSTCDENGEKFDDEQVKIFLEGFDENKGCTEKSKLSSCAALPTLVMFYTTIKEMDEVINVKEVIQSKLRVWRDAICDARQINMEVEFAKQHLIKIAYAYFASKTVDQKIYDEKKRLEEELWRISTKIELHEKCQSEAIFFNDKPLNTGLFP
ncbi:hypothetical protein ES288_A08G187900v1 [Gossypium darwinii]|uniref:Uncharacterized protein n=1 Tax=Gossypium darwinii TaxID=34276 RepID=A0A5D2FN26_GOSDA|nr:hypothetical protein ES288_A08G187900v1 [Gossypium darwinii]